MIRVRVPTPLRPMTGGKSEVEIEYKRAVTRNGNIKAKKVLNKVFELQSTLGFVTIRNLYYGCNFAKTYEKRKTNK